MLSTKQFIERLAELDLQRSSILELLQVNLDIDEFFALLTQTRFRVISSHDGQLSIVKEDDESIGDFSKQSDYFGYHTRASKSAFGP